MTCKLQFQLQDHLSSTLVLSLKLQVRSPMLTCIRVSILEIEFLNLGFMLYMRSVWLVLLVHCSIIAPWNRDSKWKNNLTNIGFNHHSSSKVQPTGSENQLVGRFYIESWPSESYTSSPTINCPIFLHRTWSQCLATLNHMDLKIIYVLIVYVCLEGSM